MISLREAQAKLSHSITLKHNLIALLGIYAPFSLQQKCLAATGALWHNAGDGSPLEISSSLP